MPFKLNPFTGKFDYYAKSAIKAAVTYDLDFSSATLASATISLDDVVQWLLRGRLYIDTDPGAGFAAWATLTIYNKAAKHGKDIFFKADCKLVYTELEVATTGSDANITPDDQTDLSPNDLIFILDTAIEESRLATIANTMIAMDNVAAHAIDIGLSKVFELHGIELWNNEGNNNVYVELEFAAAQTVSTKFELIMEVIK